MLIMYCKFEEGQWGRPEPAKFSGEYWDDAPCFSIDGKKLYFTSRRPTPSNPENEEFLLWYCEKNISEYSEPVCLGIPAGDPSITSDVI